MQQVTFGKDFLWGCATASYQVEGATGEDGRKASIWDTFCKKKGAVLNGDDGSVAADQYHLYKQDIALMAKLGFQAYRFSIAWPRIIPDGVGPVNFAGLDYYKRLCKELKQNNIQVAVTMFHWDLPQVLQDRGGWANRETAYAFASYAKICFDYLGEYVDQWITLNEPYCSAYLGYLTGEHAPGIKDPDKANKAVHYLNLAHGLAVAEYRKTNLTKPIGLTLNPTMPRPATQRKEDILASNYARAFETDVFLLPVLGKGYPTLVTNGLGITYPIEADDMEIIGQKIDFLGINYYQENAVSYDATLPLKYTFEPVWQRTTGQGWPVTPYGLLRLLRYFDKETSGMALYITENGCSTDDVVEDGRIHDYFRCDYLNKHFEICKQAIQEKINLKGYFVWSFIDNFEWSWGYSKRFGIIYDNFETQERIPKDSAYMMRDVITGYCEF
ncbi:GH1 family beta-glucosidase [uncultured Sphaerochaeta sp.]|uniref:GH1 family beta-glucosidase n=1 Tax=uncultured Sphaerochaeta sp. TaxID=886478 RepID=UPI002A0A86B9|nr:GH1 family beta-glucosidase [uncultured Sphaerochaeta sp.]